MKNSTVSIVEQAARRLEELRRAGIEPGGASPAGNRGLAELAAVPSEATPPRAQASWQRVELNLEALTALGFVVPQAPRTRLADEFRAAKRGLLVNVRGESAAPVRRANCIMVTSSLPGEGKTFTAINLAMSLAMEVDTSVMLIDADVMRPSVMERLGLFYRKGLLDLLTDPALNLADVALRTNIDKLSLLAAGVANGHATELLASAAMDRLIETLASEDPKRILVFDSPPLLAAPETRAAATHMGQIVLVIEAHRTLQRTAADALELIKDCPVVMTLLNKARGRSGAAYGYGGYGYGATGGGH